MTQDETTSGHGQRPHPVVTGLFLLFLITFFGGGLLLFVNLFVKFLPEGVFAIIGLCIGVEFVVLAIAGKCFSVVSEMRKAARLAASVPNEPSDSPAQTEGK
jgi:hypothetical protein